MIFRANGTVYYSEIWWGRQRWWAKRFDPLDAANAESWKARAEYTDSWPSVANWPGYETWLRLGRSTINTLHAIDDRPPKLVYFISRKNLPVISNQTESNGGIESNEERTWTIITFEFFLQAFDSLEKVIRKFTKCIIKPFVVRSLSEIDR